MVANESSPSLISVCKSYKISLVDYPKPALEPDVKVVDILENQHLLIAQDFEVLVLAPSTLPMIQTHQTSKLLELSVLESLIHEQCDGW